MLRSLCKASDEARKELTFRRDKKRGKGNVACAARVRSPDLHVALEDRGKESHATPASGKLAREEKEVSLTVPRCHRCSSVAAASRSCSTVRASVRGLEAAERGPTDAAGVLGRKPTLASKTLGGGGDREMHGHVAVAMCVGWLTGREHGSGLPRRTHAAGRSTGTRGDRSAERSSPVCA